MAEYTIVISAETLADKMDYDELVEFVGDLDDYLGDWDFTNRLMDKIMTLMPNEESMGAEWMDDQVEHFERWYAQLGVLILAHKTRRAEDDV